MSRFRAAIFDLDGVLCDTARFHYLAWKRLADLLGIPFGEQDNERMKGLSREDSLRVLLQLDGRSVPDEKEFQRLAEQKNRWYVEAVSQMTPADLAPGARNFLQGLRQLGVLTALGSASKNTAQVLKRLELEDAFDCIVDGTMVERAKPDPEIFLRSARRFGLPPADCVVFEDAPAGVLAAHRGGMPCVGVGRGDRLTEAELVISGFDGLDPAVLLDRLERRIETNR